MTNIWVDVMIIGGGPAGTSAGITLQKLGYKTAILDKAVFPRDKLCGGSLTQKALDLLTALVAESDPTHFYKRKVNRVNFYLLDQLITTVTTEVPFYMTDRLHLDNLLMEIYRKCGGELMEGTAFRPGMLSYKSISLGHTTIGFQVLIGADGIFSQVRKIIHAGLRPDIFCVETRVPLQVTSRNPEEADIVFGYLQKGYAWNFPKDDHFTVGIGSMGHRHSDFNRVLAHMIHDHLSQEPYPKPEGGFLFARHYLRRPCHHDGILLVGDAAGLTEPITGEGIYYALRSGQLASMAVDDFLTGRKPSLCRAYVQSLSEIHTVLRQARHFHRIFYIPFVTRRFLKHIRKRNSVARFYLDKTLSTKSMSYFSVLPRYFLNKYFHGHTKNAQK